jgi:hypothetical protein
VVAQRVLADGEVRILFSPQLAEPVGVVEQLFYPREHLLVHRGRVALVRKGEHRRVQRRTVGVRELGDRDRDACRVA